jgi:hypothetical protein
VSRQPAQLPPVQTPTPAEQVSPLLHVWQLMPPLPHAALVVPAEQPPSAGFTHPEQPGSLQNSGAVMPVHAWAPAQAWHCAPPLPQTARSVPGAQAPVTVQHPVQVAAQGRVVAELHMPPEHLPEQHSLGPKHWPPFALQLLPATQKPNWHSWVFEQALHEAPFTPHAAGRLPGWHSPVASQHPEGHVFALHVTFGGPQLTNDAAATKTPKAMSSRREAFMESAPAAQPGRPRRQRPSAYQRARPRVDSRGDRESARQAQAPGL